MRRRGRRSSGEERQVELRNRSRVERRFRGATSVFRLDLDTEKAGEEKGKIEGRRRVRPGEEQFAQLAPQLAGRLVTRLGRSEAHPQNGRKLGCDRRGRILRGGPQIPQRVVRRGEPAGEQLE